MVDLMRLFPRVLIICGGFECARHAGGYWPQDVQAASTSKPSPDWPRQTPRPCHCTPAWRI